MAKKKYKRLETTYSCPKCGSKNTNKVGYMNNYCLECLIEFNIETSKLYNVMYDGELVEIKECIHS